MNRRDFLRVVGSFLVLVPFLSQKRKQEGGTFAANKQWSLIGGDKAISGSDQTIITSRSFGNRAEKMSITFWHGPSNHINCNCKLIEKGN